MATPQRQTGITVGEAIKAAKAYVRDLFANANEELIDLRLEEVRSDAREWLITVGFRDTSAKPMDDRWLLAGEGGFGDPLMPSPANGFVRWPRVYKIVRIDKKTGKVLRMTNWAA